MFHYAVILNAMGVLLGAFIGFVFKRKIPQRFHEILFTVIGLTTLGIGIRMVTQGNDFLLILLSLVVGGVLGEFLKIEDRIESVGRKFRDSQGFAESFLTSSLLFLVGPMTIVGSLNIGLTGNAELILIKTALDTVSATVLTATLGTGVFLSSLSVFFVQGLLVLFAKELTFLMDEMFIADFVGTGGVMILGLAIRILKLREIKVGNLLPSLVLIPLFDWIKNLF
ncbi:DUF554 domain-containing protein [Thermotoga sp. KOL6]|uniref:DUF554 domain-containing protein n=1 Tax=Thermotoga sp. KOL6 TaxID=126741 RepID=UPI000C771AF6|nr:DUF554 domain-containing protein [Thermotoga sp. KOL6]PLV58981.1 hypothetical protein AS005_04285 [Thermotoga sp. KOL6]